jgi:hypothetical protein
VFSPLEKYIKKENRNLYTNRVNLGLKNLDLQNPDIRNIKPDKNIHDLEERTKGRNNIFDFV